MATKKTLPKGVPAENEYHHLHWIVLLSYLIAGGAVYMLLFLE